MNYSGTAIARRVVLLKCEHSACPPTRKLKVRKGHIKYKKLT